MNSTSSADSSGGSSPLSALTGTGDGMSATTFLAVGITLVVLSALCVVLRLVSDFRLTRKVYVDGYFSIAAIAFLAAVFGLFYKILQLPSEPGFSLLVYSRYAVAMVFISGASMWTAKAPVLLLLMRIFGINRWLRIACIVTLVTTGLAILGGDAYNAAICMPPGSLLELTPVYLLECADASSLIGVIAGAVGVAADVVIFILPLPTISKLKMPLSRKIGLAMVFVAGLAAIVASSVALYYKVQSRSGLSTDISLSMTLTLIESTIVIAAGCVPGFKAFWTGFIVDTGLYSKLSSFLSGGTTLGGSSKKSKVSENLSADETHLKNAYVSLEDHHSVSRSTRSNVDYTHAVPLDHLSPTK